VKKPSPQAELYVIIAFVLFLGTMPHNDGQTNTPPSSVPAGNTVAATGHALELHHGFVTRAKQGNLNIVFFGDSSTTCWQTTGKDIWNKEISPLNAADFGIYGDSAEQLLWRMQNGELDGYQAKAVVVMIGAVDLLRGDSTDRVVAAITACVDEIKKRQPQAKILLFVPPHVSVPGITTKAYVANSTATAAALAKLADGASAQVFDMTEAMQARQAEAALQILAAGDPHGAKVEFEVWWDALKAPLAKIFPGTL